MSRRPQTANYLACDVDDGILIAWWMQNGMRRKCFVGRFGGGKVKTPPADQNIEWEPLQRGEDLMSREFIRRCREEMGVDYIFIELAHVKPRRRSKAQSFTQEQINAWVGYCREFGVTPISPRFNTARHARRIGGHELKGLSRPRWYEATTDASILADYLLRFDNFDNWQVIQALEPGDPELRRAAIERRVEVRAVVQDQINAYRVGVAEPSPWITSAYVDDVPNQVTRALGTIIEMLDSPPWCYASQMFDLHGKTTSGRGLASLLRSEICHQRGKGQGRHFVYERGWKTVKHEYRRLLAVRAGRPFTEPRPPWEPKPEHAESPVFHPQSDIFEVLPLPEAPADYE